MKISIGIVDDHKLFLKSLSFMLESFEKYEILVEALNGKDLQKKMEYMKIAPDIMLLDVNMPLMNGVQTTVWLQEKYPAIKVVALSMKEDDRTIISMIQAGCCAYMLKDAEPEELDRALTEIQVRGYYNADACNLNYRRLLITKANEEALQISEKEKEFIKYACSDLTYKQIAALMKVSERSVDSYREHLFQKLNVQSRVGLCLEAIRRDLASLN